MTTEQRLLEAIRQLKEAKGRHNTALAYERLMNLYNELTKK